MCYRYRYPIFVNGEKKNDVVLVPCVIVEYSIPDPQLSRLIFSISLACRRMNDEAAHEDDSEEDSDDDDDDDEVEDLESRLKGVDLGNLRT